MSEQDSRREFLKIAGSAAAGLALSEATVVLGAEAQGVAEGAAPVASTKLGRLRGARVDGVATFRSVPYATPPVGRLRFAPPVPVKPWRGTRDATQDGPIAPQPVSRLAAGMG